MGLIAWLSVLLFSPQGTQIIDGYAYPLSVLPGDSLQVYLNATESNNNYPVRLYDMGGKVVAEYKVPVYHQVATQDRPWENGFGYRPTLKIVTPQLKSGVYVWENKIPLIVKARNPKIAIVYTSNTENAYCNAGGKGLYSYNSTDKLNSTIVSFKRPIRLPKHSEIFYRWFYTQPTEGVGYMIDSDLDKYDDWKNAKILMIVGHNEYWTRLGRNNFDRFVNEGKDAIVLSGNTMWWQVRYSQRGDQLICYKLVPDPIPSNLLKTVNWDNPDLEYPIISSIGSDFPRAGYGAKVDQGWDGFKITTQSPLLEGTRVKKGDIIPLLSDEADGAPLTGLAPDGTPLIDEKALNFEKIELVGYDKVFRGKEGFQTWIVIKKTKRSGTIINVGSTDWCSLRGIENPDIQKITMNMINKLLLKQNVFSTPVAK